jgi:membrane protease YdiL (CAAX protease family)
MSPEMSPTPEVPREVPRPAPPPFGARRAVKILAAFLGVQLGVAVIAGVAVAVRNLKVAGPPSPDGIQLDPRLALGAAFAGALLAGIVALRMVLRTFARPGGEGQGQAQADDVKVAVGWTSASRRQCARAALTGLALVTAFVVAAAALPTRVHPMGPLASAANAGGWARVLWALLAVCIAPPTEELVFRGVLYAGLARAWRPAAAGVATTAIFVALHATEVGSYWPAWLAIATLGALALRARVVTGSLLPAIALHASYNLGLVLVVLAQAAHGAHS